MPILYTIGYGNRRPALFFSILPEDCTLIDVRANPVAWCHQFSRAGLIKELGRRYLWFHALGNTSGTSNVWTPPPDTGVTTEDALNTIAMLVPFQEPVVLMCAEMDAERCHRRFVAAAVAERVAGLEIVHL